MVFAPALPVETERLTLRPFTRADVEPVFAYRQREDVARYLPDGPMSHDSCVEAVDARIGQTAFQTEGDRIFLAVERRDYRVLVGEVSMILRSATARQAEIGYVLNPEHHGHGFATEAARALLALSFDGAGMHRVHARCSAQNLASWRVMERLGMRREAHFRENALIKGMWDDELVYALLEDEWRARDA